MRLAIRRLRVLVATARWRSRPIAWPQVVLHPEAIYGYNGMRPDAFLVLRKHVLVTVLAVTGRTRSWSTRGRRLARRCCVGAEGRRPRGVCSDGKREFSEDRLEPPAGLNIKFEFVVSTAQVLDERMPTADHLGGA